MHKIFFTFSVLFTFQTKAQFVTRMEWSTDENTPANEVIYYNQDKILDWSDFLGEVPSITGTVAAITMSGFGYHSSTKLSGTKGEIDIGVYCFFNKNKSWVKPGKTTSYILNHEQLHFDISFIAANNFIKEIRVAKLTSVNYNGEVARIYNECINAMNKMQDDYDNQTNNGQDYARQAKWNEFVEKELKLIRKGSL